MASKKVAGFSSGMIVFLRERYGRKSGEINEQCKYKIIRIGPKQVTLALEVPSENFYGAYHRNFNETLMTKEEAESYNQRDGTWSHESISHRPSLYPYEWGQLLVPLGQEGWDADKNY